MKRYYLLAIPIILTLTIIAPSVAASSSDLTVVGVSSTGGSSIHLGLEPGAQQAISFQNVTWYIYGIGEISESVDGNVTVRHQVDGVLIVSSSYAPGRHVVTFSNNGSMQQFILQVSSSAASIDWDELSGGSDDPIERHAPEVNVWLVSVAFFCLPFPLVLRRVRRIKRSEVSRVL